MSIPEAVGLVLSGTSIGQNGDQFILDMGDPVRILDLAKQMVRLSGKIVGEDIAIEYMDLLPGEKEQICIQQTNVCWIQVIRRLNVWNQNHFKRFRMGEITNEVAPIGSV